MSHLCLDHKDRKDRKVFRDLKAFQVRKDPLGRKAFRVPLVLPDLLEPLDLLDPQDQQAALLHLPLYVARKHRPWPLLQHQVLKVAL